MVKLYSIEYLVDADGKRTAAVVPIATWKRLLSEVGLPDSGADTDVANIKPKQVLKSKPAKKKLGKAKAVKPKAEKPKEKGKPKKAALAPKKAKK